MTFTDERCPSCGLNWWLAPPIKVHHAKKVRCVECKEEFGRTPEVTATEGQGK